MKKNHFTLNFLTLLFFVLTGSISASAQWNDEGYIQVTPDSWSLLSVETQSYSNGNTYIFYRTDKDGLSSMASYLQIIDSVGNKLLPDSGLLVSGAKPTPTSVSDNKHLLVDTDGNAIVVVPDNRHGEGLSSYTAYKISPDGTFLWGNDGIDLNRGVYPPVQSNMNILQLEDGSYAFACAKMFNTPELSIALERVSKTGDFLWENIKVINAAEYYMHPYLVNAGNNEVILVYAVQNKKNELRARKINAQGTAVWENDVLVYNGGFNNSALQTIVNVRPSANGGALIAWNDDRNKTTKESAYLSYIKPDGTYGFAEGLEGLKVGHAGNRCFRTQILAGENDAVYVVWEENDASQKDRRFMLQKISLSGSLLWGQDGVEAIEWSKRLTENVNIVADDNNNVALFYTFKDSTSTSGAASVRLKSFSGSDGSVVSEKEFVTAEDGKEKSDLLVNEITNNHWTALWQRGLPIYLSKVTPNVASGLQVFGASSENIIVSYEDDAILKFTVNTAIPTGNVSIALYDISGKKAADVYNGSFSEADKTVYWDASALKKGIYIAVLKTPAKVVTIKILR